jgi:hypothetical protein
MFEERRPRGFMPKTGRPGSRDFAIRTVRGLKIFLRLWRCSSYHTPGQGLPTMNA